jgi:hypothetical protein
MGGAAFALTWLAGCHKAEQASNQVATQPAIEPGSIAAPTTDDSYQLMDADVPTRFATLQDLIVKAGNRCESVTKGVLVGGLEGTDEWRVECSDSGSWQVWFSAETGVEVDRCKNAKCS